MSGGDFKKQAADHGVTAEWNGKKWIAKSVSVARFNASKFAESFNGNVTDVSVDAAAPYAVEERQIRFVNSAVPELKDDTKKVSTLAVEHVINVRYDFMSDGPQFRNVADKKDCSEYYPPPQGYENWTHCRPDGGGSACGGPDQCACDDSQRLVTFTCDQGSYHQCWAEKGNGCRGQ